MIETFIKSFRLKNTYKTNSIIYSLKSIPLIKKLLPDSLYASHGLKIFANVFSSLYEFSTVFVGKLIYILAMVYFVATSFDSNNADIFTHIFIFTTMVGAILNTQVFNPTRDKYYAIFLMRIDTKKFTISNYYYFLLKMIFGFLPFTIIFGLLCNVNIFVCLTMPIYVVAVKSIYTWFLLFRYKKTGKVKNENLPSFVSIIFILVFLGAAYLPPVFNFAFTSEIYFGILILSIIISVFAFKYIITFDDYKNIYKSLFDQNNPTINLKANKSTVIQNSFQSKIDTSENLTSSKSGYAYFNDLFVKRHNKILTKSTFRITYIALGVGILAIIACLIFKEATKEVNDILMTSLPYFIFVMYFLNRGGTITQAMFMNCDHSMLSYRFYRKPDVILKLFLARLKTVVTINLLPGATIGVLLAAILYVTGGTTNPLNYAVIIVSLISMSVFFSVHHMVLYYLLQPYNVNLEMKNATYTIISLITYLICYSAISWHLPTLSFGIAMILFCIVYVIVAMILIYRLAPRTFKLRN